MRKLCAALLLLIGWAAVSLVAAPLPDGTYLYVAEPGIRDYLEYGGHGILVFDADHDYKFIKRIPSAGVDAAGKPLNVKGICGHAGTHRLYVSTIRSLMAFDLVSEKLLWEKDYEGGCDRMAISPDGSLIYLPSLEKDHWHVVEASTGKVVKQLVPKSGAHNTIYGADGKEVYLAGLKSNFLNVAETSSHSISKQVGPFSASIRPFTINGSQTLAFVNVNDLLGFEIGDIKSGKFLQRVEVTGFEKGPTKRHGCPSHGIALTPDETEIWLTDAANSRLHIFDNTIFPPKQVASISVRDQPGWLTISLDGKRIYPSTGEVIELKSRKVLATLKDEEGHEVQSEKLLEVQWQSGIPKAVGNQFALGQAKP